MNNNNGLLKVVIPLLMATVAVAITALTTTGCSSSHNSSGRTHKFVFVNDQYIIYNRVLHKGDVWLEETFFDVGAVEIPTPKIKSDCGIERGTHMYVSSEQKPDESEYDSICDKCF